MTISQRVELALLAGLICFGGGWLARGKEIQTIEVPKIVTKTEIQQQVKVVDRVVTKVVTVTKKEPNGTVTETTTKETAENKTSDKGSQVERDQQRTKPLEALKQASWSLGLDWTPRLSPAAQYPSSASVGYRVIGPVWGEAAFDWVDHSVRLGVRVEF